MTSTARLHFMYVVGILAAIIVILLTRQLAENEQVVGYISFALTLSSILLAVVATVYTFVSNASFAQSIGGMLQAATDVRLGAATLDRIATRLESQVGVVSEKVVATHDLVRSLSNPPAPRLGATLAESSPAELDKIASSILSHSSANGIVAMYAAGVAFRTGNSFNRDKLFSLLSPGNEDYYWGWLLALDAAGVIEVNDGIDGTWTVRNFPERLLDALRDVPKQRTKDMNSWMEKKFEEIDVYFQVEK